MRGLVDSTLREGMQASVPYLSTAARMRVLRDVLAIGVEEVELGHVVAEESYEQQDALAALVASAHRIAPRARAAVWCRARAEDVDRALLLAPDVVSFAVPVSDRHLQQRLRVGRSWALEQVRHLVPPARDGVPYVSVGLEDATRADPAFLDQVVDVAAACGAHRVRLADTVGVSAPDELAALVRRVRARFDGEIGVHVHDDFGMASAGAVAALRAGADWADVAVTGLGERCGIARTEEVAAWLTVRGGAAYDLRAARAAAHGLARRIGRRVPEHAPVVGDGIFACESGLHLAGLTVDPATYEPYPPQTVGARRTWRLGEGAGRAAVGALLPGLPHEELTAATARLRREARRRGRALTPQEAAGVLRGPARATGLP